MNIYLILVWSVVMQCSIHVVVPIFHAAGISLYIKFCNTCRVPYRYQEYLEGIHNFNDNWLLSLGVCDMIRKHIQVARSYVCYTYFILVS